MLDSFVACITIMWLILEPIIQNWEWVLFILAIFIVRLALKRRFVGTGSANYKYRIRPYFFSYVENRFYVTLKKVLYYNYWYQYEIYPKVRLADVFEPVDWKSWFKRLWMRHVDFLIVDRNQAFRPVLAIELDWYSHQQYEQHQSDVFKNTVFKESNLPLLRFDNGAYDNRELIKKDLIQYLWNPTKMS